MKTVNSRHSAFNVMSAFLNLCKNYFIVMYLSINVNLFIFIIIVYFILFKFNFLFIYFNCLYF